MFKDFKKVVSNKLDFLISESEHLYQVNVDKDEFWDLYLTAFPEGTNPIFRERTEHDCSCCRQFIKNYGTIVGIIDNKMVSIWDVEIGGHYQEVANALRDRIMSLPVSDVFYSKFKSLGTDSNKELINDETHTWHHFFYELPSRLVDSSAKSIENLQGSIRQTKDVISRGFNELTPESVQNVLELIQDKALYRGEEHQSALNSFSELQQLWINAEDKDLFCWTAATKYGRIAAIRNTAIGTLLINLSEGIDIETAVKKYESVVAPANYKRPKAIFTKSMIKNAEAKIFELGLINSLGRRYAKLEDISIKDVLWASGESKQVMKNPFDELMSDVKESQKAYEYAEEVTIEDFVNNILPTASSIELLVDNSHRNNLMSLIAAQNQDAPSLFKWGNSFSWAYSGNFTDSIKESVKARGGKVDGDLRFSLSWAEGDHSDNSDLDAHCNMPNGAHIYFSQKRPHNAAGGNLDVDIMSPNDQNNKNIVENITWPTRSKMPVGNYTFLVHNYSLWGDQKGFTAEIEFDGKIFTFEYGSPLKNQEFIEVATVHFDGKNFEIKKSIPSTTSGKEIWGIKTMQFVPVKTFMYSPNHWDDSVGNKHYFFFLEDCVNPDTPRGFFNEYLKNDFTDHKRVFEALGNKMRVKHDLNQLSGVGFSNTMKNNVTLKIDSKPINIKF